MSGNPVYRGAASPARRAGHTVLMRAFDPRAPGCDQLLEETASRLSLSQEDAALARELVYGVLRHRRWLEHLLAGYLREPIAGFAPAVHEALLIGLYQLLYTERIPLHAAVDETVRLASAQPGGAKLRGLVNAVMRRASGTAREELLPGEAVPWQIRLSVPDGLVEEVARVLPVDQLEPFFEANNSPAPLCLRPARPNLAIGAFEDFLRQIESEVRRLDPAATVRRGRIVPECIVIEGRGIAPERLPLFREGFAAVEDEGAQAVGLIAADGLGGRLAVLDLCAAPGGKTAHLCGLLPEADITATDVSPAKLDRLTETLQRLRVSDRVKTSLVADFLRAAKPVTFDLVLVDAPCSGLGTLRRHPEIRYRRTSESMREIALVQKRLLNQASVLLKPGGRLVYSICTISEPEGPEVCEQFLKENPCFTPEPTYSLEGSPLASAEIAPGVWRLLTHQHGCDSFSIARFRK